MRKKLIMTMVLALAIAISACGNSPEAQSTQKQSETAKPEDPDPFCLFVEESMTAPDAKQASDCAKSIISYLRPYVGGDFSKITAAYAFDMDADGFAEIAVTAAEDGVPDMIISDMGGIIEFHNPYTEGSRDFIHISGTNSFIVTQSTETRMFSADIYRYTRKDGYVRDYSFNDEDSYRAFLEEEYAGQELYSYRLDSGVGRYYKGEYSTVGGFDAPGQLL